MKSIVAPSAGSAPSLSRPQAAVLRWGQRSGVLEELHGVVGVEIEDLVGGERRAIGAKTGFNGSSAAGATYAWPS